MMIDGVVLGKTVVDSLPENDEACGELLELLADYLPKRYPTLFKQHAPDSITNLVTGDRFDNVSQLKSTDALIIISRYVAISYNYDRHGSESD